MERIIDVQPMENYVVLLKFSDNTNYLLDVKPYISNGISANLKDEQVFRSVRVDEFGGIFWPNGFDFCPTFLKEMAVRKKD